MFVRRQSRAATNVRVDIRTRVVEVGVEHTRITAIVPVTATIQAPHWPVPYFSLFSKLFE